MVVGGGDDFTVRGGAADASIIGKQIYAKQLASELHLPIVRLVEGTGRPAERREDPRDKAGTRTCPSANPAGDDVVDNLSMVPVVAAGLGPVAGLGAALVCSAHLSILVEGTAQLFVAGPPVVSSGTGEHVDKEQLGGSQVHAEERRRRSDCGVRSRGVRPHQRFPASVPPSASELRRVAAHATGSAGGWPSCSAAVPRQRQPYRIHPILAAVFDAAGHEVQRYGG